jgi:cell division protein FtsW (lipid II flippase)
MVDFLKKAGIQRLKTSLGLCLTGVAFVFAVTLAQSPYRLEQINSFIDPWDAPRHTDEQLTVALIAFGRS